jgi:predicted lactoylglutathione lyase
MPLLKTTPILAYLDRDATLAFYENLGFKSNAK